MYSGNHREYVHHVGALVADAHSLPEYSVKCIKIVRKLKDGEITAKVLGPTVFVGALGFAMSVLLAGMAVWHRDHMALLATTGLSALSTIIGFANKWKLNLPNRRATKSHYRRPPADVVIRFPKGNFVVVQCDEDIARELFFAPEKIEYYMEKPWKYRLTSLGGTILLMFSVIFVGNSSTLLQIYFAGAYVLLNAAYWTAACVPESSHWDLGAFEAVPQIFDDDLVQQEGITKRKPYISYNATFTEALWRVIVVTRDIAWVTKSKAVPVTSAWEKWLEEALEAATSVPSPTVDGSFTIFKMPDWDPRKALHEAINLYQDEVQFKNWEGAVTSRKALPLNSRREDLEREPATRPPEHQSQANKAVPPQRDDLTFPGNRRIRAETYESPHRKRMGVGRLDPTQSLRHPTQGAVLDQLTDLSPEEKTGNMDNIILKKFGVLWTCASRFLIYRKQEVQHTGFSISVF